MKKLVKPHIKVGLLLLVMPAVQLSALLNFQKRKQRFVKFVNMADVNTMGAADYDVELAVGYGCMGSFAGTDIRYYAIGVAVDN